MADFQRVLVAGAGPVGLFAALKLAKSGVPVTVFEAEAGLCDEYRAAGWHGPTLAMFEEVGVLDKLKEKGPKTSSMCLTDRATGAQLVLDMGLLKAELRYPYALAVSQPNVVRVLLEAFLAEPGTEYLFNHRLQSAQDRGDGVVCEVSTPDGLQIFEGGWLIGADGSRSVVRKLIGAQFDGFTWTDRFLIMETHEDEIQFPADYAPLNMIADAKEWRFLMRLPNDDGTSRWRVCCAIAEDMPEDIAVSDDYVQARFQSIIPRDEPYKIDERRIYSVHQRTANCFRKGRFLIAGDAAHLNNPLGGQGANSGIHDADNLCSKLLKVMSGEASDELLDLYDRQRRLTNVNKIQPATIANKKRLDEQSRLKRRLNALAWFIAGKSKPIQKKILRTASMIDSLEYAAAIK